METNTQYTIAGWNEETVKEFEGGKITRATINKIYTGAIEGEGTQVYIMTYKPGGAVDFYGYEWINGTIDGRTGGFALREEGVYKGTVAEAEFHVIPGTGVGALAGITGSGSYSLGHAEVYSIRFDWKLT